MRDQNSRSGLVVNCFMVHFTHIHEGKRNDETCLDSTSFSMLEHKG